MAVIVIRGILAVVVGYIVIVAMVLAGTYALQAVKPEWFLDGAPVTTGYLATNIVYSLIAAWLAGYIAALIAARAAMKAAYVLAGVSVAMAVFAATTGGAEQPKWFQVLRAVLMVGAIIAAGRMRRPSVETESQQDVAGDAAARGVAGDRK